MNVEIVEDGPLAPIEEAMGGIDWIQSDEVIAEELIASDVPIGLIASEVFSSPLDLSIPTESFGSVPMAKGLAAFLKRPEERSGFMRWLTGWTTEETYEPTTATVLWFECHVPNGGSAQVQTMQSASRKSQVGIKIYGCGFDTGRSTKLEISDDSEPRKKCAFYYLKYNVRPVRYRNGAQERWGAKFLGKAGDQIDTLVRCPYCSIKPDQIDREQFVIGESVDRRNDEVITKRSVAITWETERSLSLSIPIPHLPMVALSLTASASTSDNWTANYGFAPRSLYQGYRPFGADWEMQRWAFLRQHRRRQPTIKG